MPISLADVNSAIVIGGTTTPGFNVTVDYPPAGIAKQVVVTSLDGTQTGVRTHSPSDPFTIAVIRGPLAPYPKANLQGTIGKLGRNKTQIKLRKGTIPLVGQNPQVSEVDITLNLVSGADVNDRANVAALLSAAATLFNREAANFYDSAITGVP